LSFKTKLNAEVSTRKVGLASHGLFLVSRRCSRTAHEQKKKDYYLNIDKLLKSLEA